MAHVATARELRRRMTPHDAAFWNALRETLRPLGVHPRRQAPIGPYVVDFAMLRPRLAIELDGDGHGTAEGLARDAKRDEVLRGLGFRVLRFSSRDVRTSIEGVLDVVASALAAGAAPPDPRCRGGHPPPAGRENAPDQARGGGAFATLALSPQGVSPDAMPPQGLPPRADEAAA